MERCSSCGHFLESHDREGFCWTFGCPCARSGSYTPPVISPGRVLGTDWRR